MNNIRKHLAFFSAISLSLVAAIFSVIGLSKLFSGAYFEIIVFASFLEFGKIVAASFLQGYGHELAWFKKTYLFIAVIVIMIITSAGIYGFLSDAYQKTAHKYTNVQKQVEIIDKKEGLIKNQIQRYEDLIKSRSERENTLSTLRNTQETRIDNLLNNNKNTTARNTQKSINDANEEIKQINADISKYNADINILNDSINVYENQKLNLSNSNDVAEIGPLKYISDLTGKPMDIVVNWLILMLIFVFDPLAIGLLISAQSVGNKAKEEVDDNKENSLMKFFKKIKNKVKPIKQPSSVEIEEKVENAVDIKTEVVEEEKKEKEMLDELIASEEIVEEYDVNKEKDFESFYQKQVENIKKYRTKFTELIDILYDSGRVNAGEDLLNYVEFTKKVEDEFVDKFSIDDIKRFLVLCNYLEITSLNNGERRALVDFETAKKTLEKWFSK
jgi:hypothetical protein